MLNSVSEHLLNILKRKIKEKFNINKITFYAFKMLNTHISRQNFHINMFNVLILQEYYLAIYKKFKAQDLLHIIDLFLGFKFGLFKSVKRPNFK
jgi:uncharacterized membrane protein required for colicin V production